jgi:hypothetical protein
VVRNFPDLPEATRKSESPLGCGWKQEELYWRTFPPGPNRNRALMRKEDER